MITSERAKLFALNIKEAFPNAQTVQQAYDSALELKMFNNEEEALAVWGRLCRLFPQETK